LPSQHIGFGLIRTKIVDDYDNNKAFDTQNRRAQTKQKELVWLWRVSTEPQKTKT